MEQGSRAILALAAAFAACSCSAIFGERSSAPALEPPPAATLPAMRRIPEWVRPPATDLARSAVLRAAVDFVEAGEMVRAAVLLQQARAEPDAGPEVTALHAWTLCEAASLADAARTARAGLASFGAGSPSLNYALAVALELDHQPAAAFASYQRALAADPMNPVLLRACARTGLDSGQAAAALPQLELLASEGSPEPALLAQLAEATHAAAQTGGGAEERARARSLLQEVVLLDPQHERAHRMLGENLASSGDLAGAETALRRALELEPADLPAGLLLAGILQDLGRRPDAEAVLVGLLRQPLTPEAVRIVRDRLRFLRDA